MTEGRSAAQVRRYDAFKWITLLVLITVLIMLLLRGGNQPIPVLDTLSQAFDTLTFGGTAAPGALVEVIVDERSLGTARADDNGRWTLQAAAPSEGGNYDVTLLTLDERGQPLRAATYAGALSITGAQQAQPLFITPLIEPGDPPQVTLRGRGVPGSRLLLQADGVPLGVVTVDGDGSWQLTTDMLNLAREYQISAEQIDDADQPIAGARRTASLLLDQSHFTTAAATTAPPTEETAQTAPEFNWSGLPSDPVRGSGTPGNTIDFTLAGEPIGSTVVGADGLWQFDDLPADLPPGEYVLTATTRQSGDGEALTAAASFTVAGDSEALPLLAAVEGVDDGVVREAWPLTLSGHARPASAIAILLDEEEIDRVAVTDDGSWQWQAALPGLSPGRHELIAAAVQDGTLYDISQPLVFDYFLTETPTIVVDGEAQADGLALTGTAAPGDVVEIVVDGKVIATATTDRDRTWRYQGPPLSAGDHEVVARILDAEGAPLAVSSTLPIVGTAAMTLDPLSPATAASDGAVALSGKAPPNSTVALLVNGEQVATATADANGAWQTTAPLPPGASEVQLQLLGEDGSVLTASAPQSVMRYVTPTVATVEIEEESGEIVLSGRAAPNSSVAIVSNNALLATLPVDESGNWQWQAQRPDGASLDLVVQALDENGNVVVSSDPQTITLADAPIDDPLTAVAARDGRFTTLLTTLDIADLTETLAGDGPFTVFAPTDAAFAALPERARQRLLNDPAALQSVLLHHVVPGRLLTADIAASGTLTSAANTTIAIGEGEPLQIGGADVISANIETANGVIHAVDRILLPPNDLRQPHVDDSGVSTFRGSTLNIVGDAEPGTTVIVTLNDIQFGEKVADEDGFWVITGPVTPNQYAIRAYMLTADDLLLGTSNVVQLTVR